MPHNEQREARDFLLFVATRMRHLAKKNPEMSEALRKFAAEIEGDVQERTAVNLNSQQLS